MTLTSNLLTSKSNQVISVPICTEGKNLVKLPQADYKVRVYKLLVYNHTWTARKQNASSTILTMMEA